MERMYFEKVVSDCNSEKINFLLTLYHTTFKPYSFMGMEKL
jgi:hypothetical protein